MSAIHVRPMNASDVAPTAEWLVKLPLMQRYNLTVERARQQYEMALAQDDILLVADVGRDSACGFVWCLPKGAFGRSVYLRLIGVRSDMSGAGIGAALLNTAEQAAFELKRDMMLLVSDFNTDAQRFYQRQGYTEVGALPGYVLPDVSELIYWKPLQRTAAAT